MSRCGIHRSCGARQQGGVLRRQRLNRSSKCEYQLGRRLSSRPQDTHPRFGDNAPSGALGQLVREVVNGVEAAISSSDPNDLNNLPNGAAIDTYCGVDGNGNPLSAYFGTGRTTAFCSTFLPIYQAVSNAPNVAGTLAVLKAMRYRSTSSLRSWQRYRSRSRPRPQPWWTRLITTNTPFKGSGNNGPAMYVALYCGANQ
jgi:hypothetical protein